MEKHIPKQRKLHLHPQKNPTKVGTFRVFLPNLGFNLEPLQVKSAMFSYDGLRIITASMDGTARVSTSIAGAKMGGDVWKTMRCRSHEMILLMDKIRLTS